MAVDQHMAMADQLAGGKHGGGKFHAVNQRIEAAFKNTDQVLAGIAIAAHGILIVFFELLLTDVAIVALELLLGHQLDTEIGGLGPTLAVLARAVFTAVNRGFCSAPEVNAKTAVNLVLGMN